MKVAARGLGINQRFADHLADLTADDADIADKRQDYLFLICRIRVICG